MARLSLLLLGSRQESKDTTTVKIQQGKQQDCGGIDMTLSRHDFLVQLILLS
jgi:hypothetical protein